MCVYISSASATQIEFLHARLFHIGYMWSPVAVATAAAAAFVRIKFHNNLHSTLYIKHDKI